MPIPTLVQAAVGIDGTGAVGQTSCASVFSQSVAIGSTVGGFWTYGSVGSPALGPIQDDKGNLYTPVATANDSIGSQSVTSFYAENIVNSPQVITCKFSAGTSNSFLRVCTFEIANTARAVSLDGSAANVQVSLDTGTDAITTGQFITTNNGDIIVGCTTDTHGTSVTTTVGTGYTLGVDGSGVTTVKMVSEYKVQTLSSTTTAATFTIGAVSRMVTLAMAFRATPKIPTTLFQSTVS